ncbi:MAG: YkgJ family cysteine cluster protein [Nevskia sp.]|nr:YkgJ family cysteine cluster protein [Nevskia sp.]
MSLPELFRHQGLFVGCLAIRRAASGMRDISVHTQAFDYATLNRCPALGEDLRCSIHDKGKPAVCAVVPFDADVPDGLQHAVLLSRNRSENYIGANCIVAGESADHDVVVRDGRLVDSGYIDALARRREAVRIDRHYWGDALLRLLRSELSASASIPAAGYFTLPLVPVLQFVAGVSQSCRVRCLAYIDSQIALIDRMLVAALQRKTSQDRDTTRELRSFNNAYALLRRQLERGVDNRSIVDQEYARNFEAYLELDAGTVAT